MAAITVRHKGNFKHIEGFFKRAKEQKLFESLHKYGEIGVAALRSATPVDSGLTAASWDYEINVLKEGAFVMNFINRNVNKYVNIAIILQTGHGTRNGGYVQGRDYINPAIQPVFDQMIDDIWEEVTKP